MLECTNGALVLFSFCIVPLKEDLLLRYLHICSYKLYLLLLLETLSIAVSNFSYFKLSLNSKIRLKTLLTLVNTLHFSMDVI